jgi:hypothetical protein
MIVGCTLSVMLYNLSRMSILSYGHGPHLRSAQGTRKYKLLRHGQPSISYTDGMQRYSELHSYVGGAESARYYACQQQRSCCTLRAIQRWLVLLLLATEAQQLRLARLRNTVCSMRVNSLNGQ